VSSAARQKNEKPRISTKNRLQSPSVTKLLIAQSKRRSNSKGKRMIPSAIVRDANLTQIRRDYVKRCDFHLLLASAQFQALYDDSPFNSVEAFAKAAELSPFQVHRILNRQSLPATSTFEAARDRLFFQFGNPSVDLIDLHKIKRPLAVEVVMSSLKPKDPLANAIPPSSFHDIARASVEIEPADHRTLANGDLFSAWKRTITSRTLRCNNDILDDVGTFHCAREYLPGFEQQLIDGAKYLVERHGDCEARKLLEYFLGIHHARICVGAFRDNWVNLQKGLQRRVRMPEVRREINPKLFVQEVFTHLGLELDNFLPADATTGFLVMESPIARPTAIHVLKYYSRT